MPAYGMPGATTGRPKALLLGLLLAVITVSAWVTVPRFGTGTPPAEARIDLRTSSIGDGVATGAGVQLNGVRIGHVTAVTSTPGGTQLVALSLERSQLPELTDRLRIDYAPANLFGISEIVLRKQPGGGPLHDGATVNLTAPGSVTDVTLGNLLRSLSTTATTVLTPKLTDLLDRAGRDIEAFAPLLAAIVDVSRAIADTQRYPSSFLIEQYGSFLAGVAAFADGTVKLVDQVFHINVLRNDRAHFDVGVALVVDQLLPLFSRVLHQAQGYVGCYSDTLATVLGQLARTVPDPRRSHAELTELLDRLDSAFRPTPDGPVLGLDVVVRGMPGLAGPLLGTASIPVSGGEK